MMFKKNSNKSIVFIAVFVIFILCTISFITGIVLLRNGTLRKVYDIIFALKYLDEKKDNLIVSNIKVDTLTIDFSKKKLKNFSKLRSDTFYNLANYLSPDFLWISEKKWFKADLIINSTQKLSSEVKLIGMNPDHYREAFNWSTRIKTKKDTYIYGYKRFNLVNPYSRGYFIDQFYNTLYKNNGGLYILSKPFIVKMGDEYLPQYFEPFFSKEILENQQRRDFLILVADSIDTKGLPHLKIAHPNSYSLLTDKQKNVYNFYDSVYRKKKLNNYYNISDYTFLTAIALNTGGQTHHYNGFNLFLYADPIKGELKPFLREIAPVYSESVRHDYDSLKKTFINSQKLLTFKNNVSDFEELIDSYTQYLQKIDIDKTIQDNSELRNLYSFSNVHYPWAYSYKKRIKAILNFNKSIKINKKEKRRNLVIAGNNIYKNGIFNFKEYDTITLNEGTTIQVINSILIFKGNIKSKGNSHYVNIKGDENSSIIFEDANIDLRKIRFHGFGNLVNNKIKERDVTSAVTFVDSKVKLDSVSFFGNYSGDDLVNLFRCEIDIKNSNASNSNADAFDLDFCTGRLKNINLYNCGNDGLDIGGSKVSLEEINATKCGDKGVSIGEKSNVFFAKRIKLTENNIGIAIKDESIVKLDQVSFNNNMLDFVGFGKKSQYLPPTIYISGTNFSKINYLIEPDVNIVGVKGLNRQKEVINLLYGKKYGKATIK
jgi:hypothetical protein